MNTIREKIQMAMPFLLAATLFSIPLGPTLKSICVGLATFMIVYTRDYSDRIRLAVIEPCVIAAFLLVILAIASSSWSHASYYHQFFSAEKYSKLLLLPLFAAGFTNSKTRILAINAFITAAFLVCILSILKDLGVVRYRSSDPGEVFYNHIVTGFMVAYAAYLAGLRALKTTAAKRYGYWVLAMVLSYQVLFVNTGRTGYIVYFMLLGFLVLNFSSRRLMIGAFVVSVLLGIGVFSMSNVLSNGLDQAFQNYKNFQQTKDTSVGFRLQFHDYAKSLFLMNPIKGLGIGGFSTQFKIDNPIPAWGDSLNEPHSQYWLIASEFGVVGLGVLAYFFINLMLMNRRLVEMKPIFIGLLIPFIIANMTDSFLTNTGIGHLFVIFGAMCLGELIELRACHKIDQLSCVSVLQGRVPKC